MAFTRNFYKAFAVGVTGASTLPGVIDYTGVERFGAYESHYEDVHMIGTTTSNKNDPYMGRVQTGLTGNGGVIFGSGNEPESLDDYKLSGDILSTFTHSYALTNERDETGATLTGLFTLTNTSDSDITVGEVGLITKKIGSSTVLIHRSALESPVTIPAGGVGQVTYTIRMNYPTA